MSKTKVSVTIDRNVLERVDRISGDMSRSEVVERALKRWLSERRRHELEAQIAAYYSERGEPESEEDRDWAELSAKHIAKSWS